LENNTADPATEDLLVGMGRAVRRWQRGSRDYGPISFTVGLHSTMIIQEPESMSMVTIGAHDTTNRRSQEDSAWKAIEEAAQELGSWIVEQENVPLLIGYGDIGLQAW
jgi:hypothetical protein